MRKGFTLIELLVVVTVLPFVMAVLSGVYVTFLRDVPQATRVLQENTTVLDALGQIRRDIDGAGELPTQFDGQQADERTLLIEQRGGVICYRIEAGRLARTVLGAATSPEESGRPETVSASEPRPALGSPQSSERLWRLPNAVLTWRLWQRDARAYAVEIHSYLKQRVMGMERQKLANAHVFFLPGGEMP
jgi:prepilin-type N-terminal cleavage/methylation domain-containing protein